MGSGNTAEVEALLADDVRSYADGGGEYAAARQVMSGRARVAALYVNLGRKVRVTRAEVRSVNGLPAVVAEFTDLPKGWPPRAVIQCELDDQGLIRRIYSVSASRKLKALR